MSREHAFDAYMSAHELGSVVIGAYKTAIWIETKSCGEFHLQRRKTFDVWLEIGNWEDDLFGIEFLGGHW